MKAAAFKLVAFVVGFQLLLVAGIMAGCLFTQDKRCTGERASELLTAIGVQAFALYAAEK
jgi:uncharacterized membrane protein YcfT